MDIYFIEYLYFQPIPKWSNKNSDRTFWCALIFAFVESPSIFSIKIHFILHSVSRTWLNMIIFISFQVRYTVFINSSSFDSRLMPSQLGPALSVRPSISASVGIALLSSRASLPSHEGLFAVLGGNSSYFTSHSGSKWLKPAENLWFHNFFQQIKKVYTISVCMCFKFKIV